ncbi:MAG: hypothetical protein FWG83_03655 [Oscillospiraceae bacterium]|nr:hypothetical protein [Oscillospiraceae bacterium]
MNELNVIYSLSTAPHAVTKPNAPVALDKFELYTAALSAITRRSAGNKTLMYCDSCGAEYFERIGLCDLWDEVKPTLPDDLEGINPKMFWAAGKLFALKSTSCPVLMLDTDFIAWSLPELKGDVVAAHREDILPHIYPELDRFKIKRDDFDLRLYSHVQPLNTAFLYMNNAEFKRYYVDFAIEFMKTSEDCDDYLTHMVFAEQRLLAILAETRGMEVGTVIEWGQQLNQGRYTHTWGAKQRMREIPSECERFCEKCRVRIRRDFPEWGYIIELIERL